MDFQENSKDQTIKDFVDAQKISITFCCCEGKFNLHQCYNAQHNFKLKCSLKCFQLQTHNRNYLESAEMSVCAVFELDLQM